MCILPFMIYVYASLPCWNIKHGVCVFCCECGQGALVSPLHYHYFVLAVCVDITFLPLRLAFCGCGHVLLITHDSASDGGAKTQEFSCQHWTRIEPLSVEIIP